MPTSITKTYELISVKGVKGWVRDSWARRAIVALQTAVDGIVVPTASTENPAMDGTASPGTSTEWAKGDHVHPSDTSKLDVGKFAVVDGTLPSAGGFGSEMSYPTGFTATNCVIISVSAYVFSEWRGGVGIVAASERLWCDLTATGIKPFISANSAFYGSPVRVVLMRTDI